MPFCPLDIPIQVSPRDDPKWLQVVRQNQKRLRSSRLIQALLDGSGAAWLLAIAWMTWVEWQSWGLGPWILFLGSLTGVLAVYIFQQVRRNTALIDVARYMDEL